MKGMIRKTLTTGFAAAALVVGTTAVSAPAYADDGGVPCTTNHDGGIGYANCTQPNNPAIYGTFNARYQCAGQEGHSFTTKDHIADGKHPIRMECAPHSAVVSVSVQYTPVGG